MTFLKRLIIILCISTTLMAEGMPTSLEQAKKAAIESDKPILIDFFAVWCGPCKIFTKDSKKDADVKKILNNVILFKVDAEKGTGPELAKSYGVSAFPTFALLTSKGEVINKWAGYSKEFFISSLAKSLEDPTPFSAKLAAYEKAPTASAAASIADYYAGGGQPDKAMELYRKAESLDSTKSYAASMFELKIRSMRQLPDEKAFGELAGFADKAITAKNAAPQKLGFVFQVMIDLSKRLEKNEKVLHYITEAYEYGNANNSPEAKQIQKSIYPMYLIHIEKNREKALDAYKSSLPSGWQENNQGLNNFAWWCFENKIGLTEARQLAEKGVTLSPAGKEKAMMLDTQAEIENALGNPAKALTLMQTAVKEDPKQRHYQQQVKRFEELSK